MNRTEPWTVPTSGPPEFEPDRIEQFAKHYFHPYTNPKNGICAASHTALTTACLSSHSWRVPRHAYPTLVHIHDTCQYLTLYSLYPSIHTHSENDKTTTLHCIALLSSQNKTQGRLISAVDRRSAPGRAHVTLWLCEDVKPRAASRPNLWVLRFENQLRFYGVLVLFASCAKWLFMDSDHSVELVKETWYAHSNLFILFLGDYCLFILLFWGLSVYFIFWGLLYVGFGLVFFFSFFNPSNSLYGFTHKFIWLMSK
jgi:hypothetical protein